MALAAPQPAGAAHFKNVGKIRIEAQIQLNGRRSQSEIGNAEPFIANTFPQEFRSEDVNGPALNEQAVIHREIRIGEIDRKEFIVGSGCRTQKQRPFPSNAKVKLGKEPCAFVINALLSEPLGANISIMVEQTKSVIMLQ